MRIVAVKIYKRTVDETTMLFRSHFESLDEELLRGRLAIMNPDGVRRRSSRA